MNRMMFVGLFVRESQSKVAKNHLYLTA